MSKIIEWKRLNDDAVLPTKGSELAAGYDIRSIDDAVIKPNEIKLISTGLSVGLPPDMEMQVRPRSGLAVKHGISIVNAPGTIDPDFLGEIKVILINLGKEEFIIEKQDRIAQVTFNFIPDVSFVEVTSLKETDRGEGGFGHTGVK